MSHRPSPFPLLQAPGLLALVLAPMLALAPVVVPLADTESSAEAGTATTVSLAPGRDEIIDTKTAVVDTSTLGDLDSLLDKLVDRRVVFVGESHDRYEDHLNQLAIIRGLRARGKDLTIGMEFFQQPFQPALDDYVAGRIDEAEFLRRTDYFERWRFDYRLYRPILRLAREQGIPVIALNLEQEITKAVGEGGLEALDEAQRARIPTDMDSSGAEYRQRIRDVFDSHPWIRGAGHGKGGDTGQDAAKDDPKEIEARFERFLTVQLLWDEGMAERAARYLAEHPGKTLVVLAGAGHLEYGQGIPNRLQRRIQVPAAVVLNGNERDLDPRAADFLLYPHRVALPAGGLLGVFLDTESKGEGIAVKGFSDDSGAKAAGMKEGDRIVRVGDVDIGSYADIRIALLDSGPGLRLPVQVLRNRLFFSPERVDMQVELH